MLAIRQRMGAHKGSRHSVLKSGISSDIVRKILRNCIKVVSQVIESKMTDFGIKLAYLNAKDYQVCLLGMW